MRLVFGKYCLSSAPPAIDYPLAEGFALHARAPLEVVICVGGVLSPLLANVLLDEVDKELERRGLSFVRYADDLNVYVRSQRAGEDAMRTLRRLYADLRLRVNEAKSAVDRPQNRKFLGYSFFLRKGTVKRRVAPKALEAMKERVREITCRTRGRSMKQVFEELRMYLPGWKQYFKLADTPSVFRALDAWIRHRLRALQLKQWKNGVTVYRKLRARGVSRHPAAAAASQPQRWWYTAMHPALHIALSHSYYDRVGVPRLAS